MRALICQYLIAFVFLGLGSWALVAPQNVIDLAVAEPYRDDSFILRFTMTCFGAQAVMFGIFVVSQKYFLYPVPECFDVIILLVCKKKKIKFTTSCLINAISNIFLYSEGDISYIMI